MQSLLLVREPSTPDGTLGILTGIDFEFHTMERPWDSNLPNLSCIPDGEYNLEWAFSQKFYDIFPEMGSQEGDTPRGMCYHIMGVKDRTGILIHNANRASQLEGCVSLGVNAGVMPEPATGKAVIAVLSSKIAIRKFHAAMAQEPASLQIQWRVKP